MLELKCPIKTLFVIIDVMKDSWRKVDTEDGREILFALYKVEDINEAYNKAGDIIRIINENNAAPESQVSLSSENVTIVLHGHSKMPITQKDWEIAKQIGLCLR